MQFQGKYFVYISGLGCIWCLALHATGDAGGQWSIELEQACSTAVKVEEAMFVCMCIIIIITMIHYKTTVRGCARIG